VTHEVAEFRCLEAAEDRNHSIVTTDFMKA
jgi:hypothetical protein